MRDYKTHSNATEVINCVKDICENQCEEKIILQNMKIIAKRLLLKEVDAQEKIVNTKTEVQKGSLIQALLLDANKYYYLLAKVQHKEFVDDADFEFKTGFSKDKKTIWKSCLLDLENINAESIYAKVYSDTKAKYWSDAFLELDELTTDEVNTEKAFKAIDNTLNRYFKNKETAKFDHTIIRNSFIGYFKTHEQINYSDMLNDILGNYHPNDKNLISKDILELKEKLNLLPENKNFDRQFTPINSAIKARIRKEYPVYTGIEIKIKDAIDDLTDVIQSIEEDGVKYIRIRSNNEDTYNKFKKEN